MCKSLVCKYGFLKKQKHPHANFSPLWNGQHCRAQQLAATLPFPLSGGIPDMPRCRAAPCTDRRGKQQHRPLQQFYFPHLLLRRTLQNADRICCKCLTGGISHSPLSLVSGVGWNTEFFTCRWFSVISIFQPKSQTSSLEKNDNRWQNPWHAVTSNANLD